MPAVRAGAHGHTPIATEGIVDLRRYHPGEGRKHAGLFAVECAITAGPVILYGSTAQSWVVTNWATLLTMAASLRRWT